MPVDTSSNIPRIVVLVGLPGSGKSFYLKNLRVSSISSDALRHLIIDDATNQNIHRQVFASMRYLLKRRLQLRRPVSYVDATHLTIRERRPYIKLGDLYDCRVEALFFDVPLKVCKERNRMRPRVVPDEVMDLMASRLVPPSVTEGFDEVVLYSALSKAAAPVPTETPAPG
jgi:predicted kinase